MVFPLKPSMFLWFSYGFPIKTSMFLWVSRGYSWVVDDGPGVASWIAGIKALDPSNPAAEPKNDRHDRDCTGVMHGSGNPMARREDIQKRIFGVSKSGYGWVWYTLWSFVTVCELENGPVEIVDFPINSMVIFHSKLLNYQRVYVSEWLNGTSNPETDDESWNWGYPTCSKKNIKNIWICRETAYGPNVIYWSCPMGNDEGPLDFGYPQVWHTHSDLGKNERYFHQSK